jgi:uncharacterized nucleotidyltransferase DUF6036
VRRLVDAERLRNLMRALGASAPEDGVCYLAGGATAVLLGWRETTIDADVRFVPEQDAVLRSIPELKERLELNVELAWPGDFLPLPPGWEERSLLVGREGRLTFRHVDLYAQALAKLERGHRRDMADVRAMLDRDLVDRSMLRELFEAIEPELYRFPAIDPASFRTAVEDACRS